MWLKKIAQYALTGLKLVTGNLALVQGVVDPVKAASIQQVSDDLTKIGGVITQIEMVGQALALPGGEKLKASIPAVTQVILQSDLLIGHKIKDTTKFQQGVSSIASGMADILSSLDDGNIEVKSMT